MRLAELEREEDLRLPEATQSNVVAMPQGITVRHKWQRHLLTFLMVFGPGLIVMDADNDAGSSALL